MAGFAIELYVSFLIKSLARGLERRGSQRWPIVEAMVTAPAQAQTGGWGCCSVEIPYQYRVDGELYTGLYQEPFLLSDSAQNYASRFPVGSCLFVRVNPSKPELSGVWEIDQDSVMFRNAKC